jgi:hypothetical protein
MNSSRFIARLVGPVFVVSGAAMLLNGDAFRAMIEEFMHSPALIYLAGFLALLGGLAIVNVHNSWAWGWPLIVTAIGWLAIIGGVVRMVAPQFVQAIAAAVYTQTGLVIAVAVLILALGGFLSFKAYSE